MIRHDWTYDEIEKIYSQPFPELIYQAQTVHRQNFSPTEIQRSTLLSIKSGGCSEDCSYCSQSAHHRTDITSEKAIPLAVVMEKAQEAKDSGSTRFCMGAAWRGARDGKDFEYVLDVVRGVASLGMEVCCTLGMLTEAQALKLKEAGCDYYNHNLDTSPSYYGNVITTRTYDDRLETLSFVRDAGLKVCCGGIVGIGESVKDRIELLEQLALMNPHPDSVPINMLVRVEGTPLANETPVDPIDFVRVIATARIIMPKSYVRLSAGRTEMSDETQALALLAGANSVFSGDKLLTTPNTGDDHDQALLARLGMKFEREI